MKFYVVYKQVVEGCLACFFYACLAESKNLLIFAPPFKEGRSLRFCQTRNIEGKFWIFRIIYFSLHPLSRNKATF
jgi:hypothetical protein